MNNALNDRCKPGSLMRLDFFPAVNSRWAGLKAGALLLFLAAALAACGGGPPPSTIGRSAVSVAQESRAERGQSYTLGPQFADTLQDLLRQETEALGGSREGVPLELNRQVLLNINRFLNEDRGFITRSLGRGSKYIPMMQDIFRRKGLPEDLVYLALIESGFNNQAVSHASAAGPWQFIASTGRRYGLVINDWVDERRDPVRSTYAAADYLITLHDTFGSWPMAIAGYNSGEGKIIRGIRSYGVSNFWDMSSVGGHLADETKLYVPSFLAATFIAKDPAAYGLNIVAQPPDKWEEVSLSKSVTLAEAAKYADTTVERLQELNPHLRKAATPPQEVDFILRLPMDSRRGFMAAYQKAGLGQARPAETPPPVPPQPSDLARLRPELTASASAAPLETPLPRITAAPPAAEYHTVASGETLGGLAGKYGLKVKELMEMNKLTGPKIRIGQKLLVKTASSAPAPIPVAAPPPAEFHTVASGETLGVLAGKYDLKVKDLMEMNKLTGSNIRAGQKLQVKTVPPPAPAPAPYSAAAAPAAGYHTVASGETLGGLAEKYGLKVKDLMEMNKLTGPNIRAGQKLLVKAAGSPSPRASTPAPAPASVPAPSSAPAPAAAQAAGYHTVASGETLGGLAEKYGLKVQDLMEMNKLTGPNIRAGQKLLVKAAGSPSPGASAPGTIRVAEGDTLYGLARKHKLTVDQLKKMNNLTGDSLRLGQTLKIGN